MPLDVPAYVTYAPVLTQGVVVRGGNNYDLSRGAVATPVTQLSAPVSSTALPATDPSKPASLGGAPTTSSGDQGEGGPAGACAALRRQYGATGTKPLLTLGLGPATRTLSSLETQALNKLRVQPGLVIIGRAEKADAAAAMRTDAALGKVARQIIAGHLRSPDIRLVNTVRPASVEGRVCSGIDLLEVWRKD